MNSFFFFSICQSFSDDGIRDTCMNRSTYRNNRSMENMTMMIDNRLADKRKKQMITFDVESERIIPFDLSSSRQTSDKLNEVFGRNSTFFSRRRLLTVRADRLLPIKISNEGTTALTFTIFQLEQENRRGIIDSLVFHQARFVLVYLFVSVTSLLSISAFCYFSLHRTHRRAYVYTGTRAVVDILRSSQCAYHLSCPCFDHR